MTAASHVLLSELGFPAREEVTGLKSIAQLFGTSKRRCGIYLLALPDDRYYIGQAIDVVRRFAQHAKAHARIDGFAFLATPKAKLDAAEKELIFRAEGGGLTLVNVVHVSDIEGESDLDALISPVKLDAWLKDPFLQNQNDFETEPIQFSKARLARFESNYKKFENHEMFVPSAVLLFMYLDSAIPYPRRTEYSFWSVSCMPSTNQSTWPRLLCVSASVMELFCLGYYKDPKFVGASWGFINVASDVLFSTYGSEDAFKTAHPYVELRKAGYRDAGQHQINISAATQSDMFGLLNDKAVTQAAAALCLRIMRKRATIYSKFHCPQLADAALELRVMDSAELEKIVGTVFSDEEGEDVVPSSQDGTPGPRAAGECDA